MSSSGESFESEYTLTCPWDWEDEPTPVLDEPVPVLDEPVSGVEESAPVMDEPAPGVEEPDPVMEEPAPGVIRVRKTPRCPWQATPFVDVGHECYAMAGMAYCFAFSIQYFARGDVTSMAALTCTSSRWYMAYSIAMHKMLNVPAASLVVFANARRGP